MDFLTKLFSNSESNKNKMIERGMVQKISGSITIPYGMTKIPDRLFVGNKGITSVTVPGTVKEIGDRAFANCENLVKVKLCEGIEKIGSNVFTGCKKLRRVTYPDSINTYQGWTFYGTELEAPVMNVSKTILVFCPATVSAREWTVPDTVKTISRQAFIENTELEVLHLHEGLEKIEQMAFIECGIKEITIPYSVCEIGRGAFCRCKKLEKITISNPDTKVSDHAFDGCINLKEIAYGDLNENDKIFHLKGQPFLIQHLEDPANMNHVDDTVFIRLSSLCAKGDSLAMAALSDYFKILSRNIEASPFYYRASNYWRYSAYLKGNEKAVKWFKQFFDEHPGEHLESILYENNDHNANWYSFSIPGSMLNNLGYDFFEPNREYEVKRFENEDIVEVGTHESWEGPDEDGFGVEEYYDWWFLDENMQPIPGVNKVNASMRERNHGKQFDSERAKAAAILNQKKREKR